MESYHFIGIGGIGMSALARILLQRGAKVRGSDPSITYVTEALQKEGAELFQQHDGAHIGGAQFVIYSTAIVTSHPEMSAAQEKNLLVLHRSDLLARLMEKTKPLLVTGTHGKTTTSALLAHLLVHAGLDPSLAIGGVVCSLGTNGKHGQGPYFVAEADESDGSFLKYPCFGAIITNIEADHLDYWKNEEMLFQGFQAFAQRVESKELFFRCADDPKLADFAGYSYGFSSNADLRVEKWRQEGWKVIFDLSFKGVQYKEITIPLIGRHNVLNAAAVFGMGLQLGVASDSIRRAFADFSGVKRRLEKKGEKRAVQLFDDYAHHPSEIRATLGAVREAASEKRVVVAFQPHRYTRSRDCWSDFLTAFEAADVLLFSEIYSAGENPIEGVTAEALFAALKEKTCTEAHFVPRKQMAEMLSNIARPHDIIVTMGAGDITKLGEEFFELPISPLKIAYLCGGKSAEHEVSLSSASVLRAAIDKDLYTLYPFFISKEGKWEAPMPEIVRQLLECDLCFPIMHGPFCEDGMLQGFFETLGLAYVGPDYRAGAMTMDKAWTKHVVRGHSVAVADFLEFYADEWEKEPERILETILHKFSLPLFVKPVHLGSTIGVSKATDREGLKKAINEACDLDYKFLVEEEIKGREMEFGFLGNYDITKSSPAEVLREGKIYSYEGKYSLTSCTPSHIQVPLSPEIYENGMRAATTVYRATGCTGLARIDFFLKEDGTWVLNEVNPMPGCTPTSVYPKFWPAEKISLMQVIDRMIIAGLHRKRYHDRKLKPPKKAP